MLPPSTVSNLLVQGTFLFLFAHPGLTLWPPFRFHNRPLVKHEALRRINEIPVVFALCNVDQLQDLLSKSSSSQSAVSEAATNDVQQTLNKLTSAKGRDAPDGNEVVPAQPKDKEQHLQGPVHNTQLTADVPARPPPQVNPTGTSTNKSASEHDTRPGDTADVAPAAAPPTTLASPGRRRRGLKELADSALELAKAGPEVQGDKAGAALEMMGSVAGDKVRTLADSGGQALSGVAGPVGRITGRTLSAAGGVAAKALEAAGSGGGAVVKALGSALAGRRRRGLKELADRAMDLVKVGPGVQGDMAGAALEMMGSMAGEKVRSLADSGGQALSGVAGPVGRITGRTLTAAGGVAAKALEVAGSGSGAVVKTLGNAADSVVRFLGIG